MNVQSSKILVLLGLICVSLLAAVDVRADGTLTGNYIITGTLTTPGTANVTGHNAYAIGNGANATVSNAFAIGAGTSVTGNNSMALGESASTEGNSSVSLGDDADVSGNYSISLGKLALNSADNAESFGYNANTTGSEGMSLGPFANARQSASVALGLNATTGSVSGGGDSVAMGIFPTANGNYTMAMGYYANTSGDYAIALGANTTASSFASLVVGTYNVPQSNETSTSWVSTDDLFVIGNGTSTIPSNAFMVEKNGNIGIGNYSGNFTKPDSALAIMSGNLHFVASNTGIKFSDNTTLTSASGIGGGSGNGTFNSLVTANDDIALNAGSAGAPAFYFTGNTGTGLFAPASNTLSIAANGIESLRVASNGDIGIGQINPQYVLDVTGTGHFTGLISASGGVNTGGGNLSLAGGNLQNIASGNASAPGLSFNGNASTGLFAPANNTLAISTGGTQRLTADSSGNIGIGTGNNTLGNTLSVNGTVQVNNSSGNGTLSLDNTGNLTLYHRQGDIVMGVFGNGGGD